MAGEPLNPYAPSEALQHDEPKPAGGRRVWRRIGAIVLAVVAYPLSGVGFYVLGKPQRLARWLAAAVLAWVFVIVGIRTFHPKLFMVAFAAMTTVAFAAIVDTAFAARGAAPAAGRAWLVAIAFILGAKGGSLAVRHWLVEAFQMPSGSMIPTLLVGDHMFIKKGRADVARGDVIVFEFPADRSVDYVKRVVAIGGDTVQITDGVVSVNGVALEQTPAEGACPGAYRPGGDHEPISCRFARETNGGHTYTIMFEEGHSASDHPRTVVPDGNVFVLGDNRDNSHDSRKWGFVPVDHIKGRASLTWWSRDPHAGMRWSRVGRVVE